ncbi:MAG: hypothetical protein HWE20_12860 [Gammaproteobacteria bacterium]|nr:hypothetical protein [Gammaproteobacteria bacterium]
MRAFCQGQVLAALILTSVGCGGGGGGTTGGQISSPVPSTNNPNTVQTNQPGNTLPSPAPTQADDIEIFKLIGDVQLSGEEAPLPEELPLARDIFVEHLDLTRSEQANSLMTNALSAESPVLIESIIAEVSAAGERWKTTAEALKSRTYVAIESIDCFFCDYFLEYRTIVIANNKIELIVEERAGIDEAGQLTYSRHIDRPNNTSFGGDLFERCSALLLEPSNYANRPEYQANAFGTKSITTPDIVKVRLTQSGFISICQRESSGLLDDNITGFAILEWLLP